MVDEISKVRMNQGFTGYMAHGIRPMVLKGRNAWEASTMNIPSSYDYWNGQDKFYQLLYKRGLVGCIGFSAHTGWDGLTAEGLKQLFRYHLARFGCYGITYLFLQEFDVALGDQKTRIEKTRKVAEYVRKIDPYGRALTVHPASNSADTKSFWGAEWYDFVMLQSGHFTPCNPLRYRIDSTRPVVEGEHNYEGFTGIGETQIREAAYTAFFSGAGFTYGCQGLYAGITDKNNSLGTERWGPILTWKEGLYLKGADQLKYAIALVKSFDQPTFKPIFFPTDYKMAACEDKNKKFFYYMSSWSVWSKRPSEDYFKEGKGQWYDPRTGKISPSFNFNGIPSPPTVEDWVLVIRKAA